MIVKMMRSNELTTSNNNKTIHTHNYRRRTFLLVNLATTEDFMMRSKDGRRAGSLFNIARASFLNSDENEEGMSGVLQSATFLANSGRDRARKGGFNAANSKRMHPKAQTSLFSS